MLDTLREMYIHRQVEAAKNLPVTVDTWERKADVVVELIRQRVNRGKVEQVWVGRALQTGEWHYENIIEIPFRSLECDYLVRIMLSDDLKTKIVMIYKIPNEDEDAIINLGVRFISERGWRGTKSVKDSYFEAYGQDILVKPAGTQAENHDQEVSFQKLNQLLNDLLDSIFY